MGGIYLYVICCLILTVLDLTHGQEQLGGIQEDLPSIRPTPWRVLHLLPLEEFYKQNEGLPQSCRKGK